MSLHEISTFQHEHISQDEVASLLRSRGTSRRFSRLTLNRLQHKDGVFRLSSGLKITIGRKNVFLSGLKETLHMAVNRLQELRVQ